MQRVNFHHKKRKMMLLASMICGFSTCSIAIAAPTMDSMPIRSNAAKPATGLMDEIGDTTGTRQQKLLVAEIINGNVPDQCRMWKPVSWAIALPDEHGTLREIEVCIYVLSDYLAVGSNDDYLRVPLTPDNAQIVADNFGAVLPTPLMVNRIYQAADCKLAPQPINPRQYPISELPIWKMNNDLITRQLKDLGRSPSSNTLLAGHKKDVVITNRLKEPVKSPRVAIYGWHKLDGKIIQPLTLVHVWWYADYSHGIRLVSDEMLLGGKKASVKEILRDPATAFILSDEGPMEDSSLRYAGSK